MNITIKKGTMEYKLFLTVADFNPQAKRFYERKGLDEKIPLDENVRNLYSNNCNCNGDLCSYKRLASHVLSQDREYRKGYHNEY